MCSMPLRTNLLRLRLSAESRLLLPAIKGEKHSHQNQGNYDCPEQEKFPLHLAFEVLDSILFGSHGRPRAGLRYSIRNLTTAGEVSLKLSHVKRAEATVRLGPHNYLQRGSRPPGSGVILQFT